MKKLSLALWAITILAVPAGALAVPAGDRDRDRLPDRWERKHGLSTKRANADADPDRDRVDNRNEYREGTSPAVSDSNRDRRGDGREDTDRDGLSNADEDRTGNDPRDPDTDEDGVRDAGEHAGTVRSLASGRLTIALAGGGSITAVVSEDTDTGCGSENEAELLQALADWDGTSMAADAGDQGWLEDLDDRHDFDEACPAAWLRPGVSVREASLDDGGGPATFGEVEFIRGR